MLFREQWVQELMAGGNMNSITVTKGGYLVRKGKNFSKYSFPPVKHQRWQNRGQTRATVNSLSKNCKWWQSQIKWKAGLLWIHLKTTKIVNAWHGTSNGEEAPSLEPEVARVLPNWGHWWSLNKSREKCNYREATMDWDFFQWTRLNVGT